MLAPRRGAGRGRRRGCRALGGRGIDAWCFHRFRGRIGGGNWSWLGGRHWRGDRRGNRRLHRCGDDDGSDDHGPWEAIHLGARAVLAPVRVIDEVVGSGLGRLGLDRERDRFADLEAVTTSAGIYENPVRARVDGGRPSATIGRDGGPQGLDHKLNRKVDLHASHAAALASIGSREGVRGRLEDRRGDRAADQRPGDDDGADRTDQGEGGGRDGCGENRPPASHQATHSAGRRIPVGRSAGIGASGAVSMPLMKMVTRSSSSCLPAASPSRLSASSTLSALR